MKFDFYSYYYGNGAQAPLFFGYSTANAFNATTKP